MVIVHLWLVPVLGWKGKGRQASNFRRGGSLIRVLVESQRRAFLGEMSSQWDSFFQEKPQLSKLPSPPEVTACRWARSSGRAWSPEVVGAGTATAPRRPRQCLICLSSLVQAPQIHLPDLFLETAPSHQLPLTFCLLKPGFWGAQPLLSSNLLTESTDQNGKLIGERRSWTFIKSFLCKSYEGGSTCTRDSLGTRLLNPVAGPPPAV